MYRRMSKLNGVLFVFVLYIFRHGFCDNTFGLRLKTEPELLHVDWTPGTLKPDQWQLVYNVIGAGYHSTITVNGSMTSATIHTTDYPGMMYAVLLYGVTNGTKSYIGTRYGRSDCTNVFNTTIGRTYTVTSKGYPAYQQRGALCSWIFNGSDVTWYRIDVIDVDLNFNESNCKNYVEMSIWKLCGNDKSNQTYYGKSRDLRLKYVTTENNGERGFNVNITAIHKTDAPFNISAYMNGDVINISWNKPLHHPTNFSYVLRIHNKQQQTNMDVIVPSDNTFYLMNYRSQAGQTFVFKVLASSDGLDSDFSNTVEIQTSCDRRIHIKPTDFVEITSGRYPFGYLQGISCHYRIHTDDGFIIRIVTSDIDISGGSRCENTYLRLGNNGQFCAMSPPDKEIVIQDSAVDIFFRTNETSRGKGFNITVSSVSKPPSVPTNLSPKTTPGTIRISWKPPNLNKPYVNGYRIEYFILPDTAGGVINVGYDVTNVSITTSEHPGRLYTIRVAASTGGGQGPFSRPLFARSACGSKHHLTRKQSLTISTRTFLHNGEYQSGTICQWNIMTDPRLWLRIDVEALDIELAPNCSKDFLRVSDDLLLCGQIDSKTLLVEKASINMVFSSDFNITGKGFKLTVIAIGPKPGAPRQISATPIEYGIFVTWNKPEFLYQFVSGYLVNYHFRNYMRNYTMRVDRADNSCVLDMTSFPGRLVEVWLQAAGDMINSNSSSPLTVRNECGNTYNLSNRTEPLYITSPYKNSVITGDIYCRWKIVLDAKTQYRIHFIRYSVNNGNSCENALIINTNTTVCNGSLEGSDLDLPLVAHVTIEMKVEDGRYLNFLLSLQAVPHVSGRFSKTERISSSGAPVYSTSLAVLLTSLLSTFVASATLDAERPARLNDKEILVEEDSYSDIDLHNLLPTTTKEALVSDTNGLTEKENSDISFPTQTVDGTLRYSERNSDHSTNKIISSEIPCNTDSVLVRSPGETDTFTNREPSLQPSFRGPLFTELSEGMTTPSLNQIYTEFRFGMVPTTDAILDTNNDVTYDTTIDVTMDSTTDVTFGTKKSVTPTPCTVYLATNLDKGEMNKHAALMHSTIAIQDSVTGLMPRDKNVSYIAGGRSKCRNYSLIQAVVTPFWSPVDEMVTSSFEPGNPDAMVNPTSSNETDTSNKNKQMSESNPVYDFDHLLFDSEYKLRLSVNWGMSNDLYTSAQSSSVSSKIVSDKQMETIYRISNNAGFAKEVSVSIIFIAPLLVILYL